MKRFIFLFSFAAFAAVGAVISQEAVKAIQDYYNVLHKLGPIAISEEKCDARCNAIAKSFHNSGLHKKVGDFFPGAMNAKLVDNNNWIKLDLAAYHYLDDKALVNECFKPKHDKCNIKHFVYLMYFFDCLSTNECVELLKAFDVDGLKEDVNTFRFRFPDFFAYKTIGFLENFPYLFVTNYLIFDPQAREKILKLAQDSDVFQAVEQVKNLQTPGGSASMFDSRIIVGAAIAGLLGVAAYNYKKIKIFFYEHFNKNKSEAKTDEIEPKYESLVNPEPFI